MKTISLLILVLIMNGCTTRTELGECVGLNEEKQASLKYKYSAWNIVLGFIFMPSVVAPAYVALEALECPVGVK